MSSYRKNVAAVIINDNGEILICRRSDKYKTWQLPQGGIDKGESESEALMRELEEEIGSKDFEILGKLPELISYDWPKKLHKRGFIGQKQRYFLLKIKKRTKLKLPSDEFDMFKWVTKSEFLKELNDFKADAYTQAIETFHTLFPGLIHD